MTRYSIRCYPIKADGNEVTTQSDSGVIPESKPDYYFYNIGKTQVYVEAIYGTAFSWIGTINGCSLSPGDGAVVSTEDRPYYITGQKVTNNDNTHRALVHCSTVKGWTSYESGEEFPLKIDINKAAKSLVKVGVGYIPAVGSVLSELVDFFWPSNEPAVFDQIKDQVNVLIEEKLMEVIKGILTQQLGYMKERVTVLGLEMNDPNAEVTNLHYMNIAEDFIGFEKKFRFPKDNSNHKNINYFLLPLYSAVVNLKVLFYQFGVINQTKIALTDNNIYKIKTYLTRLIEEPEDGAIKYINDIFNDQFDLEYETCHPDNIYNALAVVRQYCAINGFEFFELWKAIIENPLSTEKPYNTTISYSILFARPTPTSSRLMVVDNLPQPLRPLIVEGRCNRMIKIDVWIFRIENGTPKIQGMKIYYENEDTYELGKPSNEIDTIEFDGSFLKKLTVWGLNSLDMLEFEFTNGTIKSAGNNEESQETQGVFELELHHIAGIFISNDVFGLGGQSAGISVSYQIIPTL